MEEIFEKIIKRIEEKRVVTGFGKVPRPGTLRGCFNKGLDAAIEEIKYEWTTTFERQG
jgi:hypothetical protein